MDLGNGWGLNETLLRKLRLLEYFADNSRGSSVPPLPEWAREPGSKEHADAISDLEDFDSRGWLRNFDQDYGGGANAQVVGPGFAFVEEVREKRQDRQLRFAAVLDAMLAWLYDCDLADSGTPYLSHFVQTRFGLFYGEPFTDAEVDKASRRLAEDEYLTGSGAMGGGVLRPMITAKGVRAARSHRSVSDDHPIPAPNITVTGDNNNVQSASPGASMTVITSITDDHRRQALQLADTVDQAQASLSDDATAAARAVRDAVRDGQDDPGVVRSALLNLRATLIGGSFDLIGKVILGGSAGLLAHYGVPTT